MAEFEDVKLNLLKSAKKQFAKYGYKKTTLDDIAQGAGKGKSSLYYYFKNKDEVFAAVVDQEAKILEEKIEEALEANEKPGDKLKTYMKVRINSIKKMKILTEAIKNDLLSNYSFIKKIRQQYYLKEVNIVKDILELGVKYERFVIKDTEAIAHTIVTVIKALDLPILYEFKDRNLDNEIDTIQQVILYGIIKRD